MTIDEAIAHAREVAEEQRVKNRTCGNCKYCKKGQIHPRQGYCYFNAIHYEHDLSQKACSNWESNNDIGCECAEEHEQIAEWLEELKAYRESLALKKEYYCGYNNAIDDCIKTIMKTNIDMPNDYANEITCIVKDEIKDILEQLKH